MMRRTGHFAGFGGCGCGCASCAGQAPAFGGFFSTILNAAGSFVGDPALGSQIAAGASPGWAAISETPDQIAARVTPDVGAALVAGKPVSSTSISAQAQQIAAGVAPDVAASLKAQGVILPAGTVGGELQNPSPLDAFGGANRPWVIIGGLALGAALLLKGL
jgi:hypothetical protein